MKNTIKKIIIIIIFLILFISIMTKIFEYYIEKKIKNLILDAKIAHKIEREILKTTEPINDEKKKFYKNVIKQVYLKLSPIFKEAIEEAESDLKKNK